MKLLKKSIFSVTFIIAMFLLSSCIELFQDIEINSNRSGKYTFKIDMGLLQHANLAAFPDASGFTESIQKMPENVVGKLNGQKGISGIENITDESKGLYGFKFEFENDKALNNAIYQLADQQKLFFMPNYIKIKRKKVIITDISPYIKKANDMAEKKQSGGFLSEQISNYIKVTTRLHLPRPAKKAENLRSKTENTTVTLTASMSELMKGINYGNKVNY
jgi:hypothetical protein